MAKSKIGDLVEIRTALGISYAQYTHEDDQHGSLVHVFDRTYIEQPVDLSEIFDNLAGFSVFFTLDEALKTKSFSIVGNVLIPEEIRGFPLFRCGGIGVSGKVKTWWLWDGENQVRIGTLTEAQKSLPVRQIWNIALMIERIECRWVWEMGPRYK